MTLKSKDSHVCLCKIKPGNRYTADSDPHYSDRQTGPMHMVIT